MRATLRPVACLLLLAVPALASAGCGDGGDNGGGPLAGDLRVFAAASLTEAFTELGAAFASDNPGVDVTFNFASSSTLARQINEGAPADVFASADEASMTRVVDEGNAQTPEPIARNRLALIVEEGNPKAIGGLEDLEDGVTFVICAPKVPCGALAAAALRMAQVDAEPASLEENVKAVVSKVVLGEADAGIVYRTDVRAAGGHAEGVTIGIASDRDLEAVYLIGVTDTPSSRELAEAWVSFVLSDEGQATLARHGFLPP